MTFILPPSNSSGIDQTNIKVAEIVRALNILLQGQTLTPQALVTASSGVTLSADIIPVDSTGGALTVTLQAAKAMQFRVIHIKDVGGAAAANNITIDGAGSETIDGAASYVISVNYDSAQLWSNGEKWFIL